VNELDFNSNPGDVLTLGSGISATQVTVTGDSSGNIYLKDGVSGDQVKLDAELSGSYYGVQVQFADGTSWSKAQRIVQETTWTNGNNAL
jgi:hypothetical protein